MKFTKLCLALSLCFMVFGLQAQEVSSTPDKVATFVGGNEAMKTYLIANLKYPDSAKTANLYGKVYVRFIVEKDGAISSVQVLKGVDELLDSEAIRAISAMPNWTPAETDGKKVRSYVTLPINFELSE